MAWSIWNLLGRNDADAGSRDKSPAMASAAGIDRQERAFETVPQRVFVDNDGPAPTDSGIAREYSADDTALLHKFNSLLDEFHRTSDYISLFYALPEVFAPIHEIASRVADVVWELRRDRDDAPVYTDATFNRLFSRPNPLQSITQMVYNSVCFEILTGRTMFYLNQPDTLPDEYTSILSWFVLPSQKIRIETDKLADLYSITEIGDLVKRYTMPKPGGGVRVFDAKRVIAILHTGTDSVDDLNRTKAMIAGADKAIKNLIPVYRARGNTYVKQGALGMFVNRGKDGNGPMLLTEAERKEASELHSRDYGLGKGQSLMAVTSANLDFVRTVMSIAELQPFDETLADAVAIYATLRVPRHLVPSKDTSTFANAEADMKNFYTGVIIPWAKKYAEIFNNRFRIPNRYIYPNFNHISFLQENQKDKALADKTFGAVWLERWKNGAACLNDWIASFGGTIGTGRIYTEKIFDLTTEEQALVKTIIGNGTTKQVTPEDTGTEAAKPGGRI